MVKKKDVDVAVLNTEMQFLRESHCQLKETVKENHESLIKRMDCIKSIIEKGNTNMFELKQDNVKLKEGYSVLKWMMGIVFVVLSTIIALFKFF